MSDPIRGNQIKSINNIQQDEHEDNLDAKRVVLVDLQGTPTAPGGVFKLVAVPYDAWSVEYPSTSMEIYRFRLVNNTGTIVASVTIQYTDDTKEFMDYGIRTYS